MNSLDETDRRLLNLLQQEFPLSVRPYEKIGQRLSISEEEVLQRVAAMRASGLIRRIGGVIDSRSLGFYSTLCALSVPEEKVHQVAEIINLIPGVTHNYLRDHKLNIWFTLTASSRDETRQILSDLEQTLN